MGPQPARPPFRGGFFQNLVHLILQVRGQRQVLAVEPFAKDLRPLAGHDAQELVGRVGELPYAVGHQRPGDAWQVQAQAGGLGQDARRRLHVLGQGLGRLPVVAERVQGLGRHGVDGVRTDQGLDVEHVGVGRVLGPGGGPEQPLRPGAGRREDSPAGRRDQLPIFLIGDLGVGDGDLAAQRLQGRRLGIAFGDALVDGLVDLAVDAADEEAGDARDPAHIAAVRLQRLEARDVGLGHRQIGVDGEEQRDIDVDPLADQGADGRNARLRPRDLDHQVRPVDRPPEPPRLGDGLLGVQGQIGRDLQADEAVGPVAGVVDRPQQIGGLLDVGDGEVLEHIDHLRVRCRQERAQPIVIVAAVADRLFEDRGIGGHALDAVVLDQALQPAALEDLAVDEVQPHRLSGLAQLLQRIGHHQPFVRSACCIAVS